MTSRYYNTSSSTSTASPYRSYYASNPPAPYSPRYMSSRRKTKSSNRLRPGTQWKAKQTQKNDEDDKKTHKFGEFSHEQIESELNKYKKGVFYHNDKIKKEAAKSPKTSSKSTNKYSQFQLTRTYKRAPPQFFEESLPRPVPPNYEQRIKTKQRLKDDDKKQNDAISVSRTKPRQQANKKRSSSSNRKQNIVPYDGSLYGYYNYQQPANISQYGAYFGMDPPFDAPYYASDGMFYGSEIFYGPPVPADKQKEVVSKNGVSASADVSKSDSKKASATNMSPGRRVNKIQKQLEYYFSAANMDNDTFLRESMDGHGWVHIDVIVAFNRMNVLGATKELVVEAAFHSTNIEVDTTNPDRIRMTKLWKEYVRKNKEKRRKEELKKQRELDLREVNEETIASIVELITKKEKRRQKRRELRKKQKEKNEKKTEKETTKKEKQKDEDTKEKNDDDEKEKEQEKEDNNNSEEMVEID